jgi:hypothetical protein
MTRTIRSLHLLLIGCALLLCGLTRQALGQSPNNDQLHTPAKGSAERQAILDAVRDEYKEGADHPADFKVNYLKVHQGWAWINVTPLDANGKQVADPAPLLFRNDNDKWKAVDWNDVPTDPDDQSGPSDPSPKFIAALQKKFPGFPTDIVPKKHK